MQDDKNQLSPWGEKIYPYPPEDDKHKQSGWRLLAYAAVGIFVVLFGLVVVGGYIYGFGEDHAFDQQGHEVSAEVVKILIANDLCSSTNDCGRKEIMFYTPKNGGFAVEIYGVQDQRILGQIAELYTNKFFNTPDMRMLKLKALKSTRADAKFPWWDDEDRLLYIKLNRRK
jgi:hypothetical protein